MPALAGRLDSVWVGAAGDRTSAGSLVFRLTPPDMKPPGRGSEQLTGLAWLPDGRQLLVASRTGDSASGSVTRTRLLLVDTGSIGIEGPDGDPVELIVVPAEVPLQSGVWSPDGRRVALLARAAAAPGAKNLLGLAVLDIGDPNGDPFHYLADLTSGDAPSMGSPVAPVAWEPCQDDRGCSADQRLIYTAPVRVASGNGAGGPLGLLGLGRAASSTPGGLFVVNPSRPGVAGETLRLGNATGLLGVAWRSRADGTDGAPLVGLSRVAGGALTLQAIDSVSGRVRDLGVQFPVEVAPNVSVIGVRWDLAHARVLVLARPADHGSAGSPAVDAWLIDLAAGPREVP